MSGRPAESSRDHRFTISQVCAELRSEFPEVSQSQIRYYEREGLVEPLRTGSNYRKFSFEDIERLRFALRAKRDFYWSLGRIRQALDEMDRGGVPSREVGGGLTVPVLDVAPDGLPSPQTFSMRKTLTSVSKEDLMDLAGIDEDTLDAVVEFGLIRQRPNQRYFDADAIIIADLIGKLAQLGLEPRHLKWSRTAADREIALMEQLVPAASRAGGSERLESLAALLVRLHAALVRSGMHS